MPNRVIVDHVAVWESGTRTTAGTGGGTTGFTGRFVHDSVTVNTFTQSARATLEVWVWDGIIRGDAITRALSPLRATPVEIISGTDYATKAVPISPSSRTEAVSLTEHVSGNPMAPSPLRLYQFVLEVMTASAPDLPALIGRWTHGIGRSYIRFTTGAGSDNPALPEARDWRYGKIADNTDAIPILSGVERMGTYSRATTDYDHGFEIPSITTTIIDQFGRWRSLAARPWQLMNRFIHYVLRSVQLDGTHVDYDLIWGQVNEISFPAQGKIELNVSMLPGELLGDQIPRRTITTADFPNADGSVVGKAVPIIYGICSNETPGVAIIRATLSSEPQTPITGLTASVSTGNGNCKIGSWIYAVWPVDSSMKALADPVTVTATTTSTKDTVRLQWTAYAGAGGIMVARDGYPRSPQWWLYDNHTDNGGWQGEYKNGQTSALPGSATSLEDLYAGYTIRADNYAPNDGYGTVYLPNPGVMTGFRSNLDLWYLMAGSAAAYSISVITNGVEQTAITWSNHIYFGAQGTGWYWGAPSTQRVVTLTWDVVPGVQGYVIRRKTYSYWNTRAGGSWVNAGYNREWILSNPTQTALIDTLDVTPANPPEDQGKIRPGAVLCLPVDTNPDGATSFRYLVCGHYCAGIPEVYVEELVGDISTPVEKTAGTHYFVEVLTINGAVYTTLRFPTQPAGAVTANVWGIESIGDGSGALITDGVMAFRHFLLNWVFNSYLSGAWFTDTDYRPGLVDLASFMDADTVSMFRQPGGYLVGGIMSEQGDIRVALQEWVATFDLDFYWWEGSFKVSMFDPAAPVDPSILCRFSETDGILTETFDVWLDTDRFANRIPWVAGRQQDGWYLTGVRDDATSQNRYNRVEEADQMELPWTRDQATANSVVTTRLYRVSNAPVMASFLAPLRGLNAEIGSVITVTHRDGLSVEGGWTSRGCKVVRNDLDLDKLQVRLEVEDVESAQELSDGYGFSSDGVSVRDGVSVTVA